MSGLDHEIDGYCPRFICSILSKHVLSLIIFRVIYMQNNKIVSKEISQLSVVTDYAG